MSSSFRALRALVLLASLCSPVFSSPTSLLALAQRSDNENNSGHLLYLDATKSSLYAPISVEGQPYVACLDNKWSGMVAYGDDYSGQGHVHPITIEEMTIQVQDGHVSMGMIDVEIDINYYHANSWPNGLPKFGYPGFGTACMGLDMTNSDGPMYSYVTYKWPHDASKWHYDMLLTYDWMDAKSTGEAFGGIWSAGTPISWQDAGLSQDMAYGYPDLSKISSQSELWLRDDGGFYIDNCFWVGNNKIVSNSQVPKAQSGKVVVEIDWSVRWSMFPDDVVKAIYGSVWDAKYYPQGAYGYWQIPCDAEVSFMFEIDGVPYTLDQGALIAPNPWGDKCIGSIFTKDQAVSAVPSKDVTLGFQFMSSFYTRTGITKKRKSYYQLLPLSAPSGGWDSHDKMAEGSSSWQASPTWSSNSGGAMPTVAGNWAEGSSSWQASPSWSSNHAGAMPTVSAHWAEGSSSWQASPTWSSNSGGAMPTVAGNWAEGSSSWQASPSWSSNYGDATPKVAGNLAEGESDDDSNVNWKDRAHLYEIIIVVLASIVGLGIVGAIVACACGSRKKDTARSSAYRSLHDEEARERKVPLYGADGGSSRYADPYVDKD